MVYQQIRKLENEDYGSEHMKISAQWLKDKHATLENEIQALQRRAAQLEANLSKTSAAILIKRGALSAIAEVITEVQQKKKT